MFYLNSNVFSLDKVKKDIHLIKKAFSLNQEAVPNPSAFLDRSVHLLNI